MTDFVVIEQQLPTRHPVRLHFVSTKPMNDRGFYNECRSWSAFMNIVKPERRTNKNIAYSVKWKCDFDLDEEVIKKSSVLPDYFDVERVCHESVDDFYGFIGYDKKTKKYI